MKREIADLIQEIYAMNTDGFTVFIDILGHIDQVKFTAYNTGWQSYADYTYQDGFCISKCTDGDIERVKAAFIDEKNKGLNLLSDEKLRKADEVGRLKARLAELEG